MQQHNPTNKTLYLEVRHTVLVDLHCLNGARIRFYDSSNIGFAASTVTKFALHTRDEENNLPKGFSELQPLNATDLPYNLFVENVRGISGPGQENMNLEHRYTLVVGPNNCGKSTFLFALQLWVKAANHSVKQLQWTDSTWGGS